MMSLFKNILLFCLLTLTLHATELIHANSYADAIKQALKEKKPVVLFAHSPTCPWCRKMEAETLSNEQVINYLNNNTIFITVDLSLSMDVEDIPKEFIPRGTPTTYFIDPKDQSLLFSMRGYKSTDSFLKRVNLNTISY